MAVVHLPTSVSAFTERGFRMLDASTGCGEKVKVVVRPHDALVDLGISGWTADITCAPCRARLGLA